MRTERIHITDKNMDKVLFDFFQRSLSLGGGNSNKERMKKILYKAIQSELTERQRECIMKYYYEEKKMKDIAAELGLDNSTISRHIASATRKLRKIAQYYS